MFFSITTFIYLINTVYGSISQHHVNTYFQIIDNMRSANITQTFEDMTIIKCADACTKAQAIENCDVASYNKLSMICHFSVDSLKTAVDVADDGWALLRPTKREPTDPPLTTTTTPPPTTTTSTTSSTPTVTTDASTTNALPCTASEYLVSGANPVPDNKLTASSSYFDFENGGYHGPSEGRLNSQRVEYANGSFDAGTWAADDPDTNPWIQVEFSSVRYVKAVATQGRWPEGLDPNYPQYVTSFLVWYSLDCFNFTCVTDVDGFNKTFDGNSDMETIVTNPLPTPVYATCIRINPVGWIGYKSMRFDVLGC